LECEGFARVDFFLTGKDEVIANEINTIPGFTKISMFPKLFGLSGISYGQHIEQILELARARHERDQKIETNRN